jgi:hypothetical protein
MGGANTGELRALDISVGGVEEREMCEVNVLDESETLAEGLAWGPVCTDEWLDQRYFLKGVPPGISSQLAQNSVTGDLPLGERIMGTEHPGLGQRWSVNTCDLVVIRTAVCQKPKTLTHPCNMY